MYIYIYNIHIFPNNIKQFNLVDMQKDRYNVKTQASRKLDSRCQDAPATTRSSQQRQDGLE